MQHDWGPVTAGLPVLGSVVWSGVAITALGFLLIFTARWSVLRTLGACAVAGLAWQLVVTLG
jgi:chromate transporter